MTITANELANHIKTLNSKSPSSDKLERLLREKQLLKKTWYKTQQEHWLGWLAEYSGPGAYVPFASQVDSWAQSAGVAPVRRSR